MLDKLERFGFWWTVGLIITIVPMSIAAWLIQMPDEHYRAFLKDHRDVIEYMAWVNGYVALALVVGLTFLTLHIAGVL